MKHSCRSKRGLKFYGIIYWLELVNIIYIFFRFAYSFLTFDANERIRTNKIIFCYLFWWCFSELVLILCILQYKYIKNIYSVRSYIIFCDLSIPVSEVSIVDYKLAELVEWDKIDSILITRKTVAEVT